MLREGFQWACTQTDYFRTSEMIVSFRNGRLSLFIGVKYVIIVQEFDLQLFYLVQTLSRNTLQHCGRTLCSQNISKTVFE